VAAREAAPGDELGGDIRGGENIEAGRAKHNCIGCGSPTDDPERVCADCRHTDSKHGTFTNAPGRPCPDCGVE
jgi:hypothetical protein